MLSCLGFKRMMWGPQGLMKLEFTIDCKSVGMTRPATALSQRVRAPNRIYTGCKSEGCSKVSSQTHWAIPRGTQLSRSPLVGPSLRVTASTLHGPSYAPTEGPMRCTTPGGIQHGKAKPPTTWLDGVQPAKACKPPVRTREVVAHHRCKRSASARICRLESRHDPHSRSRYEPKKHFSRPRGARSRHGR